MAPEGLFTYRYMRDTCLYLLGVPGANGYGSKTTAEEVTANLDLSALTVIVTGPTSGNGLETARMLAKRGARVILAARNLVRAEEVKARIKIENPEARLEAMQLDLASLQSIYKFAAEYKSRKLPLNILINNAGLISGGFHLTEDKLERAFATNHLGHFLLTNLLLDTIKTTAKESGIKGRIVIVASEAVRFAYPDAIRFDTLHDEKNYETYGAYGQTKLCNVLHSKELSRRLQAEGVNVMVNCLHPGCINTNFGKGEIPFLEYKIVKALNFWITSIFFKTLPQAASTTCYVATHPSLEGVTGKYFMDCDKAPLPNGKSDDSNLAKMLWRYSEELLASKRLPGYVETSWRWDS